MWGIRIVRVPCHEACVVGAANENGEGDQVTG